MLRRTAHRRVRAPGRRVRFRSVLCTGLSLACGGRRAAPPAPLVTAAHAAPTTTGSINYAVPGESTAATAAVPPPFALAAGYMPLASTGVTRFHAQHPAYDGRGVLIAILDSGIDPRVAGLLLTSTGAPKILDLRDFSREGRVALTALTPSGDKASIGGQTLSGAGRIARVATGTWYGGVLREIALGPLPGADLNGNGSNTDVFAVIAVRASDGWVAFVDTNLNGSFEDEQPVHDFRNGRETLAFGTKPLSIAANFDESNGTPVLDFVFDNSGHGTHVAGIAAGHRLFDLAGFDGVAPGAQLLGLKITHNGRGGLSVTGSLSRALSYAARFAEARGMPLVLNLSFAFGAAGAAAQQASVDSLVDDFLAGHPAVVLVVSAGNDGPGLSTVGAPASADLALSVGAVFPGVFAGPPAPGKPSRGDVVGWWSARGGKVGKPDVVGPGFAFSTVPPFATGSEIRRGTSVAAPHIAGLAARLLSALTQENRRASAADVIQALRMSAAPFAGTTALDRGTGLPRLETAYQWLVAGHQGSQYVVREGTVFRREGFAGPEDSVQTFHVRHVAGLRAARFVFRSSAPWLSTDRTIAAGPFESAIPVRYDPTMLTGPGVYTATVTAWNPNDTLAGPLFALVNTVIQPFDLSARPFTDRDRAIPAGRVQRYFLRVPRDGATLDVAVTLTDGEQHAAVRLYDPAAQPIGPELPLGGEHPSTARYSVTSDESHTGVWELDVMAPPYSGTTCTADARIAALSLNGTEDVNQVEVANTTLRSISGSVHTTLLGAARDYVVEGHAEAETISVRVPIWATRMKLDVTIADSIWRTLTGFGLTAFDSAGRQWAEHPLHYPEEHEFVSLPPGNAGRLALLELLPAFTRATSAGAWRARLRVEFLLDPERPFGKDEDVSVVAGGRVALRVPEGPALPLGEGFHPLIEVRVRPANTDEPDAVRRVVGAAGKRS